MALRTLLIDNYDSYTYNLFQLIAEVNGALPTVLRNDEVSWPELERRIAAGEWHNIVISPGPGTPEREADVGLSMALLRAQPRIPILGVCLGFQALALAHGGAIAHAPEPVHGRLSAIAHSGHPLFGGIPSGRRYAVVRYHSLLVEEASLPSFLEPLAWTCGGHHALQLGTDDDAASSDSGSSGSSSSSSGSSGGGSPGHGERLLMALAHRSLPHYGVQFHPESVATGFGAALLRNFAALTWRFHGQPVPALPQCLAGKLPGPPGSAMPPRPWEQAAGNLRVHYRHLPGLLAAAGGSEGLFWHLFGGSSSRGSGTSGNCTPDGCCSGGGRLSGGSDPAADTFWLDSATPDRGRFSFMGGRGGSLWRRVVYRLPPLADQAAAAAAEGAVAAANENLAHAIGNSSSSSCGPPHGTLVLTAADGSEQRLATDFFAWLQGLLASHRCRVSPEDAAALPFDFWGGLVGYLGYELKAECGGRAAHASPTPDAAFLLADQLLAIDHHTDAVYVLALYESSSASSQHEAQQWVDRTAARVQALATARQGAGGAGAGVPAAVNGGVLQPQANGMSQLQAVRGSGEQSPAPSKQQQQAERPVPGAFQLREGRQRYLKNVASCMQALYDGESYEVCLTTMLSRQGSVPRAEQLYRTLRRVNPAPYAAWLRFGAGADALQLCCCSPERFLRGGRGGLLEAKPIKGTAPRSSDPKQDARAAAELAASEKDRAENLMIVDLLRNDLGRVCEPGSVHVPALMHIESYATVHQMVSTVRGLRRPGASIVDCLRAAFPGGSMTGAPKIRTMEIIDQLEQGPRGVYSGSLGFISFNDTFDLNIVIRTAVLHGDKLTIGAGGAIVVQSDPEGEYEEMRLKARALLRAIGECDGGSAAGPAGVDEA